MLTCQLTWALGSAASRWYCPSLEGPFALSHSDVLAAPQPAVGLMCINFPWSKPKNLPKDEDPEAPQQGKGPPGTPQDGPCTTAPVSSESAAQNTQATSVGGAGPPSDTTSHGPAASSASAQPGQPANPVSLPTQRPGQPAANPKAPGPSYESDDEAEAPSAEARLNDITRSVKSHARAAGAGSADEFARRQAEAAARRLAAEHGALEDEAAQQVGGKSTGVDVSHCTAACCFCEAPFSAC